MKKSDDKPLRILVVDDEREILEIYKYALGPGQPKRGSSFALSVCSDGNAAIDLVQTAVKDDHRYAVVFLDLNLMHEPDGIAVGERIRELDPDVNFVIVTGMTDISPGEIAVRIPPADKLLYVQKPFHVSEIRQFASALVAKWQSEMLLKKTNRKLGRKVEELKRNRKALMANAAELESTTRQLMETNNALSVLARNLERSRKQSEKRVFQRAVMLMTPIIDKLRQDPHLHRHATDLNLLDGYVKDLTSGLTGELKAASLLSVSEMRIASYIRNGMTSEEIAKYLFISVSTVKTHRKNIRRKLKLSNSRVNLRAYLMSEMQDE